MTLRGFFVWRQNNVGVYDAKRGVYRSGTTMRGVSDILGLHEGTGRMIAVEVKAGKDTTSDYQVAFLQRIENAGGIAIVARDFTAFQTEIEAYLAACSEQKMFNDECL